MAGFNKKNYLELSPVHIIKSSLFFQFFSNQSKVVLTRPSGESQVVAGAPQGLDIPFGSSLRWQCDASVAKLM